MAQIGLLKGSGKQLKVREKSVKSQRILKRILSGNPAKETWRFRNTEIIPLDFQDSHHGSHLGILKIINLDYEKL